MLNQSIADFLTDADVTINNTLNDTEVQASLAAFGYDAAKLAIGSALLAEAEQLAQQKMVKYGNQFAASEAIATARETAHEVYARTLKVARVAFKKNVQAASALMLNGRRKDPLSGWLLQTLTFYKNMLDDPALIAAMTEYGYTEAKLTAELALVTAVQELNQTQEREKGKAQASTKIRDAKFEELSIWLADFRKIAAVALASTPQKLEGLGLGPVA